MPRGKCHVGPRGEMRKEPAFLNHVAHAVAQRAQIRLSQLRAVDSNRAPIGTNESDDQAQQRRLSASAGPDEHRRLARRHLHRHVINSALRAERFSDIAKGDHSRRGMQKGNKT